MMNAIHSDSKECPDAPILLYFFGNTDLNQRHVINIIGTRHCTPYGRDIIHSFVRELKALCPDILILSGLAYGVDIHAHREALENGFNTIGVLAHGLDDIYPRGHRETVPKDDTSRWATHRIRHTNTAHSPQLRTTQPYRSWLCRCYYPHRVGCEGWRTYHLQYCT